MFYLFLVIVANKLEFWTNEYWMNEIYSVAVLHNLGLF